MLVPRKICPKCRAAYEGQGVKDLYSCEQCGNGYLTEASYVDTEKSKDKPLPRSGGGGTITHTRDGF